MVRWHDVRGNGLRLTVATVTLGTLTALASCSGGSSLSEEDFKSGVCRDSAQSVIAVDDAVQQLEADEKAPAEVVEALKQSQTQLREVRDEAEEALTVKISALTNAIGAFRIGIDAGTIGPEQTELVDTALQGVIDSCTTS
jgi:hypothetical protein